VEQELKNNQAEVSINLKEKEKVSAPHREGYQKFLFDKINEIMGITLHCMPFERVLQRAVQDMLGSSSILKR
jgi:hypothetical protein